MYKQLTNRGVPHQKLTSVFGNNLCFSTFQNGEQGWQANVIQFSLEKETFFHAFLSEKSCFCFIQTCWNDFTKKWCCSVVNFCKSCVGPFVFLGNVSLLFLWDLHDAISHANWSQFFSSTTSFKRYFVWMGALWIQVLYDTLTNNVTFLQFQK